MASRRSDPAKPKPPKDAAAPSLDGPILSARRETVDFQDLMKGPGRTLREFALHTLNDFAERDDHCVRLTTSHKPYDSVLKLSNVKRIGVAQRAGRVGLPESAPSKAVGVDCGAPFHKAHPTTIPVIDPISIGCSVTQSDLIQRHRKIRSGLAKVGYRGEVLSFDWPARGNAASYLEGRVVSLRSAGNAPAQAEKSGSENVEIETPNLL